MSPEIRQMFARRIRSHLQPGISEGLLRRSSLFLQFSDDTLAVRWQMPAPLEASTEIHLAPRPGVDVRQLVGKLLPELPVEDPTGRMTRLRTKGPLLLYVAPAWPRPVVVRKETFADLAALQRLSAGESVPEARSLVVGTGASGAELDLWWKDRGVDFAPLALSTDGAQALGVRQQPVAIVLDRNGRVTWVKEGYEAGAEAKWSRQLEGEHE
jgi:hypothetical protein